jgi:hypothetical protein
MNAIAFRITVMLMSMMDMPYRTRTAKDMC